MRVPSHHDCPRRPRHSWRSNLAFMSCAPSLVELPHFVLSCRRARHRRRDGPDLRGLLPLRIHLNPDWLLLSSSAITTPRCLRCSAFGSLPRSDTPLRSTSSVPCRRSPVRVPSTWARSRRESVHGDGPRVSRTRPRSTEGPLPEQHTVGRPRQGPGARATSFRIAPADERIGDGSPRFQPDLRGHLIPTSVVTPGSPGLP